MKNDWLFFQDETEEYWANENPSDWFKERDANLPWSDPKSNPVADIKRYAEHLRSASANRSAPGSISYTYTIDGSGKLLPVATTGTGVRENRTYTRWVDKTA